MAVVNTRARIRSTWGENRPITGSFDPALAVKCANGIFVGTQKDGVLIFRGIPYACAPVGENGGKSRYKLRTAAAFMKPGITEEHRSRLNGRRNVHPIIPRERIACT